MKYEEEYLMMYEFILNYVKNYFNAPTIREIEKASKLKSTGTVHLYLKRMQEEGLVGLANRKIKIKGYKLEQIEKIKPCPQKYNLKNEDQYILMYKYIVDYIKTYFNAPTNEEIKKAIGFKTTGTVYNYLQKMQENGLLALENHKIIIKGYIIVPEKAEPIPKPGVLKKALNNKKSRKR